MNYSKFFSEFGTFDAKSEKCREFAPKFLEFFKFSFVINDLRHGTFINEAPGLIV